MKGQGSNQRMGGEKEQISNVCKSLVVVACFQLCVMFYKGVSLHVFVFVPEVRVIALTTHACGTYAAFFSGC